MSKLLVGAFNTRSTVLTRGTISRVSSSVRPRWLSTQGVAKVDEDLDAALDSLLESSAFDDDDFLDVKDDDTGINTERAESGSQPLANLLEDVSKKQKMNTNPIPAAHTFNSMPVDRS